MAFIHMAGEDEAASWFARYRIADLVRISDPGHALYRAFGLHPGSLRELGHPRVWGPWWRTAVMHGHGAGWQGRHWRQLTGVFLLHRDSILAASRHRNSSVRPDYLGLVRRQLDGMI